MLVLSRKENETIVIEGNIRVTIVRCGRGKVKLGIEAPDHVSIKRAELVHRDEESNVFPPLRDVVGADVSRSRCGLVSGAVYSGI